MANTVGDIPCPSCGSWWGSHNPGCLTLVGCGNWPPMRTWTGTATYGPLTALPLSDSDVERIARRVVELMREPLPDLGKYTPHISQDLIDLAKDDK